MWTIFKVVIEFVTMLLLFYVLVFWPRGMWYLNSPNLHLLHWKVKSHPLDHQGSPTTLVLKQQKGFGFADRRNIIQASLVAREGSPMQTSLNNNNEKKNLEGIHILESTFSLRICFLSPFLASVFLHVSFVLRQTSPDGSRWRPPEPSKGHIHPWSQ